MRQLPELLLPGDPLRFPDPRKADPEGLLALGGDLSPERLLAGYRVGVFPWYDEDTPPLWWSPDPRGVLEPSRLRVPHRLRRRMRKPDYRLSWNEAFVEVMQACGEGRDDGSWIIPEMLEAYTALHDAGHAHSLEVWVGDELAGGIYGVQVGALFAAESKFHRRSDMSKVALVSLVRALTTAGIRLMDLQFVTPHLAQFGAENWKRERYLDLLPELVKEPVDLSVLKLGQNSTKKGL